MTIIDLTIFIAGLFSGMIATLSVLYIFSEPYPKKEREQ